MTTINTSTLNSYSSAFTLAIKKPEVDADKATANATATSTSAVDADAETATDETSADGKTGAAEGGGTVGGSSKSALDETMDRIKEQIKQTQKQLAEQQAQLAAAQSGKGTQEEKAQKAMTILGQIAVTSAALQTLQGALLQLQTDGGVNTTA